MLMFLLKGLVFHINFQVMDISFNFIIFLVSLYFKIPDLWKYLGHKAKAV